MMEASCASPYNLWLHDKNHTSSSLTPRGPESASPTGNALPRRPVSCQYTNEPPPRPSSHHYGEALPQISLDIPLNQFWNQISMSWETPIHSEMTASLVDAQLPVPLIYTPCNSRRYSREGARTSVYSQKNSNFTGFDLRYEAAPPAMTQQIEQLRSVSPVPSSYTESANDLYDQQETSQGERPHQRESYLSIVEGEQSRWSSDDSLSNLEPGSGGVSRPFYKLSEHMANAKSPVTSLRHKRGSINAQSKQIEQDEITTLSDLLANERARRNQRISWSFERDLDKQHEQELTKSDALHLTPRPLALRPKRTSTKLALITNRSVVRDPRDPLEHDIDEMIHSMNETKLYNTPTTGLFEECRVPPPLKPTRKLFGSGKHQLKSPFPFRHAPNIPETVTETESIETTFGKRLSSVVKHFALSPSSPKRGVISNGVRRPSGPDTPHPNNKSPFQGFFPLVETTMQKGGVHLQEAVIKAKKTVGMKNSGERHRQSLKKRIVYVGISDQSSGTTSIYEP